MGWTGKYLGYNIPNYMLLDEVKSQIHPDYEILQVSKIGNTYWMALKRDDMVFAAVVLTRRSQGWFDTKIMDESCGPYLDNCPLKIMKILTPIDSEWANEWREKVWAKHGYTYNRENGSYVKVKKND